MFVVGGTDVPGMDGALPDRRCCRLSERWTILVRPAGANPLLAYFLHPIIVELIVVAGVEGRLLAYQQASQPITYCCGLIGYGVVRVRCHGLAGVARAEDAALRREASVCSARVSRPRPSGRPKVSFYRECALAE